ncbi:hypothetical protein ABW20_dc0109983 [Dactylellina cionopaga]|nr:hypothetical protein ABW20_dc0109983 [Dactylellina cionopaga]
MLLSFASGQTGNTVRDFPGKNTVDNSGGSGGGAGEGTDVAAVTTEDTSLPSPTPTFKVQPSSISCTNGTKNLRLSDYGPYMPVTVDGKTYTLAIALGEENTYLFSEGFCERIGGIDKSLCYPTTSDDGSIIDTIQPGVYTFGFYYDSLSVTAEIGSPIGTENVVLDNYPIRVVNKLERGSPYDFEVQYGGRNIQGILGLKNSSDLVQLLSTACNEPAGYGIQLQSASLFSFGGFDVSASSIGTPNSEKNILPEGNNYDTAIDPVTPAGFKNNNFQKISVFDSTAGVNTLPKDVLESVEAGFAANTTVIITINGASFSIPWDTFIENAQEGKEDDMVVLGAPFFRYAYTALVPGSGNSKLVFSQIGSSPVEKIQPFSDSIYRSDVTTTTESGGGVSSSAPKPSSSNSNNNGVEVSATQSSRNNTGAIVGGVVGGVVALSIIIFAACCFYRRRKLMENGARNIEKEYEAEFDAEIGHQEVGFFPHFTKESGYATLPTPPPPPPVPQIPPLNTVSPIHVYDSQTEYTPTLHPYHDESPSRSLNTTPLPPPSETPIISLPVQRSHDRRVSATPSLSLEPPSPLSRNVSAVSRREYPGISQMQNRSMGGGVPEEDNDDYDMVSMASGPAYRPVQPSMEASSSAPRLPFSRTDTDRNLGL